MQQDALPRYCKNYCQSKIVVNAGDDKIIAQDSTVQINATLQAGFNLLFHLEATGRLAAIHIPANPTLNLKAPGVCINMY